MYLDYLVNDLFGVVDIMGTYPQDAIAVDQECFLAGDDVVIEAEVVNYDYAFLSTEEELKVLVTTVGPTATTIDIARDFQFYGTTLCGTTLSYKQSLSLEGIYSFILKWTRDNPECTNYHEEAVPPGYEESEEDRGHTPA